MIPFPGESVGIDSALVVEGVGDYDESLYDSIRRRGSIGSAPATRALSSDEWRVWVYPGSQTYLEDDATDVVVSWVVEVASGSGTITASMGFDPMFGDPEAAHPTSLGAHPVTGPATLVLPTGLTAADVMTGDDSMMLVLTSTGALDVAQVKLRVWPSAGVAGGWSATQPGFSTAPSTAAARYGAQSILGESSNTDPETAWDDAYADFTTNLAASSAPAPRTVTGISSLTATATQGSAVVDIFTEEIRTAHTLGVSFAVFLGADWRTVFPIDGSLVEGVDWIRPPAEVADDPGYVVQRDSDGSTGWLNAVVTVTTNAGGDADMPGDGIAASEAGTFTPVSGVVMMALNHAGSTGVVPLDTSGQDIAVTMTHQLATGAGEVWPSTWDHPGVLGLVRLDDVDFVFGVDGVPVQTYATLPPYRVWVPTIVEAIVSKVRQFHRDDGLGVTPPRAFGGASRIRTGRAYGYD